MVEGCQAGRLGHLLQHMYEYNAESPTQGRKGFNSIVKSEDDILFLSYYYLSMVSVNIQCCRSGMTQVNIG